MQDGYGREIDYLRLSVTDLCNYRCVYCMGPEGVAKRSHADILSIEELSLIHICCGCRQLRVGAGPPGGGHYQPAGRLAIRPHCRQHRFCSPVGADR